MDADLPVFIKPMQVEIDGIGRYRKAETVQQLAGMLLSGKWHHRGGAKYHRALMRSIEAIEFYVDGETARAAFVDAAHEAGMHILPDDMAKMKKAS
ncbi:hypothetical protein J2W42_006235 [Rhizobium tibeticum]|uniref:DUF982 domain-containing protein n=1 Tax=Rhizobium tibeticum TaxID=501024 RepID=A0A1H8S726_9HYPH|nr:DUF982 domain-containing protein [Rhizobium tibeticum]MDP9813362.1 hypothetical protein [Rhizobium tibeticum]SEI10150.1 hypothetical protein RTCCBAU85039_4515 [Rhizobium tibeticum]SEO74445.1 Protein of unknown function [Rhizobium tibeticum]